MDGKRVRDHFSFEVRSLKEKYKQFENLLPSARQSGSSHKGEDGRYVESLIREYLGKFLPGGLELLTGFILRPSTKTGKSGKSRKKETDKQSAQLDIIVYDVEHYPVFLRFGNNVIVPPEGVIGIISVKKTLTEADVKKEIGALFETSRLCHCKDDNNEFIRPPFLSLISMRSTISKNTICKTKRVFDIINYFYSQKLDLDFSDTIGLVSSLTEFSVFKKRPDNKKLFAQYIGFNHLEGEEYLGLEFILTGLLSVYYDKSRNFMSRPGFTSFESGREGDFLGKIDVASIIA